MSLIYDIQALVAPQVGLTRLVYKTGINDWYTFDETPAKNTVYVYGSGQP